MVSHKPLPQVRLTVTTGGAAYSIDGLLSGKIVRNENGFDIADFTVHDGIGLERSRYYPSQIDAGSLVKCEMKDSSETAWTTVFNGVTRFAYIGMTKQGHKLDLKCDGAGYGFEETGVGEEYGTESRNPTLDKISEILTDANHGIVPIWVNSILGNVANASGYSYTYANVEDIVGSMKYVYFPFKPCSKALADLGDLLQAIKGANAGCHWIVGTDDKFRLKTVGSDQAGWTGYYGGSQAASTLEEGNDPLNYSFESLTREANYVLYHGTMRKPADGDKWTENNSGLWAVTNGAVSDENAIVKIGSYSLQFDPNNAAGSWIDYPAAHNASWNITNCGGRYNIPSLSFWVNNGTGAAFNVCLVQSGVGYFQLSRLLNPPAGIWQGYTIPVGPYGKSSDTGVYWVPTVITGAPSWSDIDYIAFIFYSATGSVYLDGLQFNGHVLRGAKEAGIGATNKLKLKVITDDVGKDDSLVAADDSGVMAQLAKAELYRCKTTPLVGEIRVPYLYDLLPGQLLHVHAKKNTAGTFNIDRDMRAVRVEHDFDSANGFKDRIAVTSDVINSYPRMAWTNMNKVLAAARPEFQDRQATSVKTREIDITQTILEVTY